MKLKTFEYENYFEFNQQINNFIEMKRVQFEFQKDFNNNDEFEGVFTEIKLKLY